MTLVVMVATAFVRRSRPEGLIGRIASVHTTAHVWKGHVRGGRQERIQERRSKGALALETCGHYDSWKVVDGWMGGVRERDTRGSDKLHISSLGTSWPTRPDARMLREGSSLRLVVLFP